MRLLEHTEGRLVFHLGTREKTLLERLLSLYPIQTDPETTLSRLSDDDEKMVDAAALLRDALRQQRGELTDWIELRLTEGEALRRVSNGWRLTLEASDVDPLLRVLNELRVGSWTRLGCPAELDDRALLNSASQAPFHAIMTLAGQFAMAVLFAAEQGSGQPGSPPKSIPPPPPAPPAPTPDGA